MFRRNIAPWLILGALLAGAAAPPGVPDGSDDDVVARQLREAARGVTYRYRLSVDVTDNGGETRTAERVFRLGFVSVEARIESPTAFLTAKGPAELTITRTDLDGTPRPLDGNGDGIGGDPVRYELPDRYVIAEPGCYAFQPTVSAACARSAGVWQEAASRPAPPADESWACNCRLFRCRPSLPMSCGTGLC